jgi:hypothetical protein
MAVLKLRNYNSKQTFNDTMIFGQMTLEKPQCGENQ